MAEQGQGQEVALSGWVPPPRQLFWGERAVFGMTATQSSLLKKKTLAPSSLQDRDGSKALPKQRAERAGLKHVTGGLGSMEDLAL